MRLTTALNMTSTPVFYSRGGRGGFSFADLISGGAVYFVETYGEQSLFDLSDALDPIINETYPEIMENY